MSFSSDVKKELLNKKTKEPLQKKASFLRDAFLKFGTMTDPSKYYHLEFKVTNEFFADKIIKYISQIKKPKIIAGVSVRNNFYVIYIKACENIMDFLIYIGATSSAMQMMQIKMVKDLRNRVNRATNFETANLDKTVQAADLHIQAIKKIQKTLGLDSLSVDLQEISRLRLKYPELSLQKLGEKLDPPISKSGVNHRLKKILELAQTL